LIKRKKKLTHKERMEKAMDVVLKKVMKRQQESDDKYVEVELKRMKMEELLILWKWKMSEGRLTVIFNFECFQ